MNSYDLIKKKDDPNYEPYIWLYNNVKTNFINVQGGGGHSIRKNSMGGSAPDRSGAPYIFRSNSFIKPLYLSYCNAEYILVIL